jgi:hypothetical protein
MDRVEAKFVGQNSVVAACESDGEVDESGTMGRAERLTRLEHLIFAMD